ncbi:hypothetical protein LY01_02862 [Nonlabens xylanidelens]|uniref:DUF4935 domain-containing protein n=1 Tax=Nonlabens xylanidelens TaxID=191564 RepID=A0A2S6IF15_9FLAO|nr:PIN domain-containing protein [Nonlabens xylanidelens]PPK92776.1 hypothetical protein LY01_02862 [Nonlabens xylanidelens]PQJ19822.1 hypothetical protein BST94_06150 [Nonlabens xylanidelens]
MLLESEFLFLDTSIFQAQNFTEGEEINKLFKTCADEGINICIVDIIHRECHKRIESILTRAKTLYKQANTNFSKEGRVLRLLEDYNSFNPLPKIDIVKEHARICEIFDAFLKKYNVSIISSDNSSIAEVFEQYFTKKSPFGQGQKKDEFPDAFVLNTIEIFCKERKCKAFLLSQDNDMLTYESERIISQNGIADMLNSIVNAKEAYKSLYELVNDDLNNTTFITTADLEGNEDAFSVLLYEELISDPHYLEAEYEPGEINNFTYINSIITSLDEYAVEAQIKGYVDIMIPMYYNDLSSAFYDREDGRYYNVTNISEQSIYQLEVTFQALFEFDYDGNEIKNFKFSTIWELDLIDWEKTDENITEKSEYGEW